ncbi:MAG: phage holin, partial [Ligilactobacillus ruminis]
LYNADGTLNRGTVVGLVSALLLLAQQIAGIFGLDLTGQMSAVQDCVNTVLTILTVLGVVSVPKDGATHEK